MKIKGVDFAYYVVRDLKKSIDFYQNTLGLTMTSSSDTWAEFDAGNLTLTIGTWGAESKTQGSDGGVAFSVDDVKKSLAELKKKGVKVNEGGWEGDSCIGGSFEDPDGNVITLHHRKDGTVG
jgi:predicted enzyme related to lactoylglutathione lyase